MVGDILLYERICNTGANIIDKSEIESLERGRTNLGLVTSNKEPHLSNQRKGASMMETIFLSILYGLPIIIVALLIRWIRFIKENSDLQVEQNKEIISLLKEIRADHTN